MRVLVFGHRLEVGGTQVNAIELSTYLRDVCGHEITYFATPGPMNVLIDKADLRFRAAPEASSHPSPARMRVIDQIIRSVRPDVVHIWDWPQWLDAFLGVQLLRRMPVVVTCMSMVVPSVMPKRAARTTFGTPELVERARVAGYRHAHLIMPPVDIKLNSPDRQSALEFRKRFEIDEDDVLFVTVSRLVDWMKTESISRTMGAIRRLGSDKRLRFVVVGDGSARADLEALAAKINAELGRNAILLTGALLDPRPAYAAADAVIGMGGSALRGMAFEKPVIVVGERNFSALFSSQTREFFYTKGIYGEGDGRPGSDLLVADMTRLVKSPEERRSLGQLARSFVEQHYSIDAIGRDLNDILVSASTDPFSFKDVVYDTCRTASLATAKGLRLQNPWRAF
ncbi:glycosyltransferase family 4 protein [Pararhizobium sp. A13]|uniref:glycosyltransferase family 4 protein n=1 Tax=Pararhizobium sp. A13 TaxID=3133975 RepID=UPI0032543EBE